MLRIENVFECWELRILNELKDIGFGEHVKKEMEKNKNHGAEKNKNLE